MMLFKPEHVEMIKNETKTATRRNWKKPMVKVGGIYKVKTRMITKDYHCLIRVKKIYKEMLCCMTDQDAVKEGYSNLVKFARIWEKINKKLDPNQIVTVVEFELFDNKKLALYPEPKEWD